jgi:hypothetical protein
MANFEELSRQLGYTFTELENAQGTAKRRWLRKAHLLLLLADEMIADAEPDAAISDESSAAHQAFNDDARNARSLLRAFAEDALHSAERGPCRGLQSVLVLRQH